MTDDVPNKLIADYLDDTADEQQLAELSAWVLASRENAKYLYMLVAIERGLVQYSQRDAIIDELTALDQAVWQDVVSEALNDRRRHEIQEQAECALLADRELVLSETDADPDEDTPPPAPRIIVIPKPVFWGGLAATLGLILWLGSSVMNRGPGPESIAEIDQPLAKPVYIASVRGTVNAAWAAGDGGDRLEAGVPLELVSGYAEIEFDDGATVIVQAPAKFTPIDSNAMHMAQGRVTVTAPISAYGFYVDTPHLRVTDLGTEFGVEASQDNSSTYVYQGEVVLAAPLPNPIDEAPASRTLLLKKSQGAELVVTDNDERRLVETTLDTGRYVRVLDEGVYQPTWKGALRYGGQPGEAIDLDEVRSDTHLYMLSERRGVQIPAETIIGISQPGAYQSDSLFGASDRLARDATVDSYLIQLRPNEHVGRAPGPTGGLMLSATIRFPRPIVGVMVSEAQMVATDSTLGLPGINFSNARGRTVLERIDTYGPDVIQLSEDRRTLTVSLYGVILDHVRVLIESPTEQIGGTTPPDTDAY